MMCGRRGKPKHVVATMTKDSQPKTYEFPLAPHKNTKFSECLTGIGSEERDMAERILDLQERDAETEIKLSERIISAVEKPERCAR
jgi:hypothetical protein